MHTLWLSQPPNGCVAALYCGTGAHVICKHKSCGFRSPARATLEQQTLAAYINNPQCDAKLRVRSRVSTRTRRRATSPEVRSGQCACVFLQHVSKMYVILVEPWKCQPGNSSELFFSLDGSQRKASLQARKGGFLEVAEVSRGLSFFILPLIKEPIKASLQARFEILGSWMSISLVV